MQLQVRLAEIELEKEKLKRQVISQQRQTDLERDRMKHQHKLELAKLQLEENKLSLERDKQRESVRFFGHCVNLESDLVRGEVVVAVLPVLPVEGVDVILGNDSAGALVWGDASVVVTPKPTSSGELDDLAKWYPSVFPACAITRAMAKKHWEYGPDHSNSSEDLDLPPQTEHTCAPEPPQFCVLGGVEAGPDRVSLSSLTSSQGPRWVGVERGAWDGPVEPQDTIEW
ncbi:hypothetical protein SKAU_G00011180 [Synaphobranchus kaupii]|uniref:Uncharacterized protein n=1 Tax=Synaphobranchus kaupii TaxID=118154 RepID=A0A9Q1JCZ0_SYNKA|nr:hypothetical protein SKAU_G00011180 [Synaphobranchus kaupii]